MTRVLQNASITKKDILITNSPYLAKKILKIIPEHEEIPKAKRAGVIENNNELHKSAYVAHSIVYQILQFGCIYSRYNFPHAVLFPFRLTRFPL